MEVEEVEAIVYGFNCTVFGGRFEGIEVENVKVKWILGSIHLRFESEM